MVSDSRSEYFISNSELQAWKRCRRKWWLAYHRKMTPKLSDLAGLLASGSRVHEVMACWYQPDRPDDLDLMQILEDAIARDRELMLTEMLRVNADELIVQSRTAEFDKAVAYERAMIEGYTQWIAETGVDAEFIVIGSEVPMVAPLTRIMTHGDIIDVSMIGILDVRVERVLGGAHAFIDHKPQPLWAKVLTPSGWTTIGDIAVGDIISTVHGETQTVLAVYDRGIDDVYAITLNDDTVVYGTKDHPWWAKGAVKRNYKLVDTEHLTSSYHRLMKYTPHIDTADTQLPIDPYTLGTWISNGGRNTAKITDGIYETLIATGGNVKLRQRKNGNLLYEVTLSNEVKNSLHTLNLLSTYSDERFIPSQYIFNASYQQRLQLLRGLMDGDGSIHTTNSIAYHTTSKQLSNDVASLVRSLGGWAKIWCSGKLNHVGTKESGYDTNTTEYIVYLRTEFNPFAYIQHKNRLDTHRKNTSGHRGVSSSDKIVRDVIYVGKDKVRCIEVSSPDQLYITDDYTATHNTTASLTQPLPMLRQNEQMLHYILLELMHKAQLLSGTQQRLSIVSGAYYNMLKRVKRTGTAKPPFFDRVYISHSPAEIESYRTHLIGATTDILRTDRALAHGADPQEYAYPSIRNECAWDCEFFSLCHLFDDGGHAEAMLAARYMEHDPLDRYRKTDVDTTP